MVSYSEMKIASPRRTAASLGCRIPSVQVSWLPFSYQETQAKRARMGG